MCLLKCTKAILVQFLIVALLLVHGTGLAQEPTVTRVDLKWVFITDRPTWKAPSKDPELPKYETALVSLLVFYPTGEFAAGDFWVGRNKHGEMFILPGEGFAVRKGHWSREGSRIDVTSRWTSREKILPAPSAVNSPAQETWTAEGVSDGRLSARLIGPSQACVPLRGLQNLSTFESIVGESK